MLHRLVAETTSYVLVWGAEAKGVEDLLDRMFEDCGYLNVTTTSHEDETLQDVIEFIRYGAVLPSGSNDIGLISFVEEIDGIALSSYFLSKLSV